MGMRTTHVTFRRHVVGQHAVYKCACGKRFKRTAKEEWTENPYNNWRVREAELNQGCRERCTARLAAHFCPSCGAANAPTKTETSHEVR